MTHAAPATPSLTDSLIDRYLDITSWSASRKAAFVHSYQVVALALLWAYSWLTISRMPELVSWEKVAPLCAPMLGTVILIAILCIAVHRAGMEGRWVPYVSVVPTAALYIWLLAMYGTLSTPLAVLYPMLVIIVMLIFGKRVGWFLFALAIAVGAPVILWEIYAAPNYAPAFVDRTIDGQRNGYWFAYVYGTVQFAFFLVLGLVHLAISAREHREIHLAEAHERLAETNERLETASRLIRRYVPSQLADKILSGDYGEAARPERRKLTLFFSDIEGFTAASDQLEPEELAWLLNEYLTEMAEIAAASGATVNQFVGDGIMILFGAPEATDDRDHALRAVRMAQAMQRRMAELRLSWFATGFERPFRIRIGIHTGIASVGNFGSADRMAYSAIGKETNLTARIQSHCDPGGILISHSTWALVRDEIECHEKGEITVKGIHHPVRIYAVAPLEEAGNPL
jgi:adenylate cyclase